VTADEYVRWVLSKYKVSTGPASPAYLARQALAPTIRTWAGINLLEIKYSGSYAKGTAVRGRTDVDLLISLSSDTPDTLRDIYNSLYQYIQRCGFSARRQDVSIGITYDSVNVDLVPARKHPGHTNDHSLYRRRGDTWTQTNVDQHISLVFNSGRTEEIRAVKIWRQLHAVDFPSIYLELTILHALYGKHSGQPATNTLAVLQYLRDSFSTARVVDPANSNNVISNELFDPGKLAVASAARTSLTKTRWEEIIW
jgi:hypothetical protein